MKTGIALDPSEDYGQQVAETAEEFDFVEIYIGEMETEPEDIETEELREALDEKGLDVVIHLGFRQPLVTTSEVLNDAVLEDWRRVLELFPGLGAGKAVVHANLRHGEDYESVEDMIGEQVRKATEMGEELGIEVCFENVGPFSGVELFELGEILDRENASMCFDTGHAFMEVGQEEMEEWLEEYSHLVSHLHVQDTREGKDLHLAVGEGQIDFASLTERLQDFSGTACLEIYTADRDYIQLSREKFLQHF